ncbi:MAG: FG-GAP repeat protein, partial [Deltaproteobacteria bacterium]|nr:FG-GAP repeat protein [Deltaproteobacteria bacterium]
FVKASNTGANDRFGTRVSLSEDGRTLAVGASFEDSADSAVESDDNAPDSGAVYVFFRRRGIWTQQAYLKASTIGTGDRFGFSISVSNDGDSLAVGAFGESSDSDVINGAEDNDDATNAGAAYVFVRDGGICLRPRRGWKLVAGGLCEGVQFRRGRPIRRQRGSVDGRQHPGGRSHRRGQ